MSGFWEAPAQRFRSRKNAVLGFPFVYNIIGGKVVYRGIQYGDSSVLLREMPGGGERVKFQT
jgi:hypothetical protein